jgi:O-antigen/teichoic acid export membrane protein
VYGERWQPAAPALAALAVLGGFRILFDLAYDLLAGVGRTRSLLAVQLAWFAGLLVALPIGAAAGGIGGVGVAHLVVAVGLVGPLYLAAIARAGIGARVVLSALAPAAYGAAGCAAVIVAGRQLGWAGWVQVLALGAAGAVTYVLVVVVHPAGRGVVRDVVPHASPVEPSDQIDHAGQAGGSFVPAVLLGE